MGFKDRDEILKLKSLGTRFYTVTTNLVNVGTGQQNVLLLRLVAQKNSDVSIKCFRFGNTARGSSIIRIYSNVETVTDAGIGLLERPIRVSDRQMAPNDLLVTRSPSHSGSRGRLLNTFIGPADGSTLTVKVNYEMDKPDEGFMSTLLFTCQNSAAATPTHIDIDWEEKPV